MKPNVTGRPKKPGHWHINSRFNSKQQRIRKFAFSTPV